MNLQAFYSQANKSKTDNTNIFGGITTEIVELDSFKIEKKTYCYTDKSTQIFEKFFYENEEIKFADFLILLSNYKK